GRRRSTSKATAAAVARTPPIAHLKTVRCHQGRGGAAEAEAARNTSSCQRSSANPDGRLPSRPSSSAYSLAIFEEGAGVLGSFSRANSHSDLARSASSVKGTSARSSASGGTVRSWSLIERPLYRASTAAIAARSETYVPGRCREEYPSS